MAWAVVGRESACPSSEPRSRSSPALIPRTPFHQPRNTVDGYSLEQEAGPRLSRTTFPSDGWSGSFEQMQRRHVTLAANMKASSDPEIATWAATQLDSMRRRIYEQRSSCVARSKVSTE